MDNETTLREWRDNLVNTVIPLPDTWYTHPIHANYQANTEGDVRNITRDSLIVGSADRYGRTTISVYKNKKQKHRFMMECLHGVEIPKSYDIDHVDKDPGNNTYANLKIVTRKEHCVKTSATNPGRGKKATIKFSKRILCQTINDKGECIEERVFDSVNSASKEMKLTRRPIQSSIKTHKPTKSGYLFSEAIPDQPNLDGERWEEYKKSNLWVSNKGRVWFKYQSVPCKTYGSKSAEGYYIISHHKRNFKVHNLVALLFIGDPPTPQHTIDHIDRNSANNHVENLRWATTSEQALNRTSVKPIVVYHYLTGEIVDRFESSKDCCEKYKVFPSIVSNALGFGIYQCKHGSVGNRKDLHIRYEDDSPETTLQKEISILEHQLEVLVRDKNKRKSNDENLPVHITKRASTYVLTVTFRGTQLRECSNNIDDLLLKKEAWINEQRDHYMDLYRRIYGSLI